MTFLRNTKLVSNIIALGALVAMSSGFATQALAGGTCAGLTLTCENGRSYPLCPIAVSIEGEIVTGRLGLAPGRGAHVRLVPMGVGYRYIGRNVWFDGVRNDAVLYLGKRHAVACTVSRD